MGKIKTILGLAVFGVLCSVGVSNALEAITNTATIDSTLLGPAWVDSKHSSHKVMMSAIMGWKADKSGTPFGNAKHKNKYIAGKAVGIGALTAAADGCGSLGPDGGIQDNVRVSSSGVYKGVTVDDGFRHVNGGPRDGCGNFSSSPQTAPSTKGHNATGVITQNIDFLLNSDSASIKGDAISGKGKVKFSMVAQSHKVIDWGTKIDQKTELRTKLPVKGGDGRKGVLNNVQRFVLDNRLAGKGFTAYEDSKLKGNSKGNIKRFDLSMKIKQDTIVDNDTFFKSGGKRGVDMFSIKQDLKITRKNKNDLVKNGDFTQNPTKNFENTPPGFF